MMFASVLLGLFVASAALAGPQALHPTDTLDAAKLSRAEVRQLIRALEQLAYDTPDSWDRELRAKRMDLGGAPGLVLQGTNLLCGATGNCQIFVFRKLNGQWISMFRDQAPVAEAFEFGPGASNGLKDLTVIANTSAATGERVTYKFDGKSYQRGGNDCPGWDGSKSQAAKEPRRRRTSDRVTVRGILTRSGKAGNLWTLTLDRPIELPDSDSSHPETTVRLNVVSFIGGRSGPQIPGCAGKHVELIGHLLRPYGAGAAAIEVETVLPVFPRP